MPSISSDVVLHGASDLGREANLWSVSEPKLEQSGNSYEIPRSSSTKAVGWTTDDLNPIVSSRSLKSTTKSVRFSNSDGGGGGQGERGARGGMVVEEVGAHRVHGWQGGVNSNLVF
ncbi:hypothetical protein MUK42_11014 [Musa troglodytarum]|uniref:Uncharacterized protein n=1 Tax=Musa troglodytarum TaxID=320322 RepID=A0A9E7GN48_9LILI|nr:hypothetical protein MUK42_11014 [Musa troglodytarum]